jgi:hypothetical protein
MKNSFFSFRFFNTVFLKIYPLLHFFFKSQKVWKKYSLILKKNNKNLAFKNSADLIYNKNPKNVTMIPWDKLLNSIYSRKLINQHNFTNLRKNLVFDYKTTLDRKDKILLKRKYTLYTFLRLNYKYIGFNFFFFKKLIKSNRKAKKLYLKSQCNFKDNFFPNLNYTINIIHLKRNKTLRRKLQVLKNIKGLNFNQFVFFFRKSFIFFKALLKGVNNWKKNIHIFFPMNNYISLQFSKFSTQSFFYRINLMRKFSLAMPVCNYGNGPSKLFRSFFFKLFFSSFFIKESLRKKMRIHRSFSFYSFFNFFNCFTVEKPFLNVNSFKLVFFSDFFSNNRFFQNSFLFSFKKFIKKSLIFKRRKKSKFLNSARLFNYFNYFYRRKRFFFLIFRKKSLYLKQFSNGASNKSFYFSNKTSLGSSKFFFSFFYVFLI